MAKAYDYDVCVVGAGFSGCTIAERMANLYGKRVLLIDRNNWVGGAAGDYPENGFHVHRTGPHLFHTKSDRIMAYLESFAEWRDHEHQVVVHTDGQLFPFPINLLTIEMWYRKRFTSDAEARHFFEGLIPSFRRDQRNQARSAEEYILSRVPPTMYKAFYAGYTEKQWGKKPSEILPFVAARIPVRMTRDCRYFTDPYQKMPVRGYTDLMKRMVDNPLIDVRLNTEFKAVSLWTSWKVTVWTGRVDTFFDHRLGTLEYRSLKFEKAEVPWVQSAPVINYNDLAVPFTRISDYARIAGRSVGPSILVYEYPCDEGPEYYPMPTQRNMDLAAKYATLAADTEHVYFAGRLGTFQYLNMDMVVGSALKIAGDIAVREGFTVPT